MVPPFTKVQICSVESSQHLLPGDGVDCTRLVNLQGELESLKSHYINMYSGPLPQNIIAALSTFFGIHDEFTTQLDEAMMELAGVGIDDVQEVTNDNDNEA